MIEAFWVWISTPAIMDPIKTSIVLIGIPSLVLNAYMAVRRIFFQKGTDITVEKIDTDIQELKKRLHADFEMLSKELTAPPISVPTGLQPLINENKELRNYLMNIKQQYAERDKFVLARISSATDDLTKILDQTLEDQKQIDEVNRQLADRIKEMEDIQKGIDTLVASRRA